MRKSYFGPLVALVLVACLAAPSAASSAGWREPFEPSDLVPFGERERFDACSCLNELRACLLAAAVRLAYCLDEAHNPGRETLCYLKAELDVVLCLERAAVCQLTCRP